MVENPTGVLLTAFESTKNLLEYVKAHPSCKNALYLLQWNIMVRLRMIILMLLKIN